MMEESGTCTICGAALLHASVVPGYQEPLSSVRYLIALPVTQW